MGKNKKIERIIEKQLELIRPSREEISKIGIISKNFIEKLEKKLKEKKIKAEVFIGGSFAKNTLVKKDVYDIDIFVRFDPSYKNLSYLLKRVLPKSKKIHGSRDYYQIKENNLITEIIPVIKILKPEKAVNVTDLSYFHVNYILKKIKKNKKLANEIILAKAFVNAQNCYGAESYIKGFSGYALELLICHYKTFLSFIKEISKLNKKLVIDDENFYKNSLEELNKSKTYSPIVLIDPTFKERNALSSLSNETFYKFKEACKNFLKFPSSKFFIKNSVFDNFKKYRNVKIVKIKTNKQPGDIAGTKSKKFFDFLIFRLKKEFEVKKSGFEYNEYSNSAEIYLVLSRKKQIIVKGPPIFLLKNLDKFKKIHPKTFIKNKFAYAKIRPNLNFNEWFKYFLKKDRKIISDMSVREIKLKKGCL